ncbi:MAG: Hpt domain-containing protein [Planctomycetes bacterium]|nr:Hpt domain-containing protein [Planctomycetota bacterium]
MEDDVVFNMEQLLNSTCDDRELASQVVGVFLSDIPVQLQELDKALAAGDAKTAERVAHSIKGASATVGGCLLRDVAFACEQYGREARLADLQSRVRDLRDSFEALKTALLAAGFTAE